MGSDGQGSRSEELSAAAITADDATLDAACLGFHRAFPYHSAKRVLFWTQGLALAALGFGLFEAFKFDAARTLGVGHALLFAIFASAIFWRLWAAASLTPLLSRLAAPARWPVYTLLCPLYREANVTPDLIAALRRIDYPAAALDIKLLIESDDADTLAAALAFAGAPNMEIVLIPPASPRTKPKALNVGLARARGEYVVVYDAEDRPHPQQLRAALAAFEDDPALACVQAPLCIDNPSASWITRQFAAEYAIQFRQMLPLLARLGLPMPLGGTSNHFRIDALRAVGGWDPYNVTEDADLGYRLARARLRCGIISPPTHEEAPVTLKAWLGQRTRWIKGHLQTWLVLMRAPFRTAREMGLAGFATMQLTLAGGLAAAFVHGPLALILLIAALAPETLLGPADFALATFGYCVAVFAALSAAALSGDLSHIRAAPTMPFYWPLSSLAAFRALFELIIRPHHWQKTAHGASQRRVEASPTMAAAETGAQASAVSAAHMPATSASR